MFYVKGGILQSILHLRLDKLRIIKIVFACDKLPNILCNTYNYARVRVMQDLIRCQSMLFRKGQLLVKLQ